MVRLATYLFPTASAGGDPEARMAKSTNSDSLSPAARLAHQLR